MRLTFWWKERCVLSRECVAAPKNDERIYLEGAECANGFYYVQSVIWSFRNLPTENGFLPQDTVEIHLVKR